MALLSRCSALKGFRLVTEASTKFVPADQKVCTSTLIGNIPSSIFSAGFLSRSRTFRSTASNWARTTPSSSPAGSQTASAAGTASASAASQTTKVARGTKRSAKPKDTLTILSTWFWRGIYLLVGASAAGAGALYVTDPVGTRQLIKDIREDVDERIRYFTEPSRAQLLPDHPYPGAPVLRTLVIDLDETLVHSSYTRSNGWRVAKRPGAEAFLAYLAQFYEIVVFTSNLNSYADPILDRLDPNGYISYRLYRPETKYEKGVHVKDLSSLNRDLSRVIVIDHDMKHCKYHVENAIQVPKWTGDPSDTAFFDLIPFLESIVKEDVEDVRTLLGMLRGKDLKSAISDYDASLAERAEQKGLKSSLFFGSARSAPPPTASTGVEDEGHKGAVWSNLTGTARLFHPPRTEISQEAQELKKKAQ